MSKVYSLKAMQKIPADIHQVWDFFSNPANLSKITPDGMDFKIISQHHGGKLYAGQVIEYSVRPVLGIAMYWMTEITHVVKQQYFIDEQRFGPYSLWHHQHHFKEIENGVEMIDIVHYKLPFGWVGDIAHALFVKDKLKSIFDYRYKVVEQYFGKLA